MTLVSGTGGIVVSDPAGIYCGAQCVHEFDDGAEVTLIPTPLEGLAFTGWSGACTGTGPCTLRMTEPRFVQASFGIALTVTLKKAGRYAGDIVGSGRVVSEKIDCGLTCVAAYDLDDRVTLRAEAAAGSVFDEWLGACSGRVSTCQVTMDRGKRATAVFRRTGVVWEVSSAVTRRSSGASVSIDPQQNAVVTGSFWGRANFGVGEVASAGFEDIFIAKYASNGSYVWAKTLGSPDGISSPYCDYFSYYNHFYNYSRYRECETGWSVATDPRNGDVVVATSFFGTVNPVGVPGGTVTSLGLTDGLIIKYSAAGVYLWSKRVGSAYADNAHSVAIDPLGNVVVAGDITGPFDFGGGAVGASLARLTYLVRYDAAGAHVWSKTLPTSTSWTSDIRIDPSANIIVAGTFRGSLDLGGGALNAFPSEYNGFVVKYNAQGAHVWSKAIAGRGAEGPRAIAVGPLGEIAVTGRFYQWVDFGGASLGASYSAGFITKYDADSGVAWARALGSPVATEADLIRPLAVTIDSTGAVVASGTFTGAMDFGGGVLTSASSANEHDIFLVKLGNAGTHIWSQQFGPVRSGDLHGPIALSTDGWQNIFLLGVYAFPTDLGAGSLSQGAPYKLSLAKFQP
ncbi:MAG: SBBP repeat-containing protein [Deltaproteobacteria bacterium]|nr:SBBP repeat-containing protein [Deltaproteobacteria bacterium]